MLVNNLDLKAEKIVICKLNPSGMGGVYSIPQE